MAAKRQNVAGRPVSGSAQTAIVNSGLHSRVHKPSVTDAKKRAQAIKRATSRVKTTARIDTVTLGRDY